MPVALPGAVGASQLTLLHSPHVATLARPQEPWSVAFWVVQPHCVQGLPLALLCSKSRTSGGLEGMGHRRVGACLQQSSLGQWERCILQWGLAGTCGSCSVRGWGMEGHFGGFILLTEESATA